MLALRFANGIFEPIWNRQFIDHVQITVAESLGIEGRAGFYESGGRDPRHLPEPPAPARRADGDGAADRLHRRLGAEREGEGAEGDAHARARSTSSAASTGRATSRARRWRATARRKASPGLDDRDVRRRQALRRQLALGRHAVLRPHGQAACRAARRRSRSSSSARRTRRSRTPRPRSCARTCCSCTSSPTRASRWRSAPRSRARGCAIRTVHMDFMYGGTFRTDLPEAYERLILDAMLGDQTLFTRSDEVEEQWALVDAIVAAWQRDRPAFPNYPAGTWGPAAADELIAATAGSGSGIERATSSEVEREDVTARRRRAARCAGFGGVGGRQRRADLRTSVMTHLAWVPPEWEEAAVETLAGLGDRHPVARRSCSSRARRSDDGLDAKVSVLAFPLARQRSAHRGRGDRAAAARARASTRRRASSCRCSSPACRSSCAGAGGRRSASPQLEQLVDLCDRLIVDSASGRDVPGAYRELAFERTACSDIAWRRTEPGAALAVALARDRGGARAAGRRADGRGARSSPAGCARGSATRSSWRTRRPRSSSRVASTASRVPSRRRAPSAERPALGRARRVRPRPGLRGRSARRGRLSRLAPDDAEARLCDLER